MFIRYTRQQYDPSMTSNTQRCLQLVDGDMTHNINFNIFEGKDSYQNHFILAGPSAGLEVWNNTFEGSGFGSLNIQGSMTATANIKNNCIFNTSSSNADFVDSGSGTTNFEYNATDDEGTADNNKDISPVGETEAVRWGEAVTDYINGDYTIKDADSVLKGGGTATGRPSSVDILGNTYVTDDIGAFAFVAAGGADEFFENRHPIDQGMKPITAAGLGGVLIQ